ncbi:serine--tRNA ligase [Gammaproteobacteria bacterium]|nr:serine--tRNA ligase [Gammaproteobacteria bacterium]
MLDIKTIRESPATVQKVCDDRCINADISMLLAVDNQRRKLLGEAEELRSKTKKEAALVKSTAGEERQAIIMQNAALKKQSKVLEDLLASVNSTYNALLMQVPNLLAQDTPAGKEEKDNVELLIYGKQPEYEFESKDHIELGNSLGMDFAAGARVAGTGFPLLKGDLALLENAILRFTLDQAIEQDFTPVNVPLLAKQTILEGVGFNPRRNDDGTEVFSTIHDELCLAGTAEISLVGHYSGEMIDTSELPIRLAAMTPCFRREGSYGRRDAGLYRNKMFNKVELVILANEAESDRLLEEIRAFEVSIFEKLGLYFRVIRICAGDLGAQAYKKYDLEGWMKGRSDDGKSDGWGELTSCSNCTDFQSRRLNIRHRNGNDKPRFVHTLNGTGITSRALIPLLEQYQRADGSISIPDVLQPYIYNREVLVPKKRLRRT